MLSLANNMPNMLQYIKKTTLLKVHIIAIATHLLFQLHFHLNFLQMIFSRSLIAV